MENQSHNAKTELSPSPDAHTGDLTGKTLGDYHLLRKLGKGGMGQVYLAEQVSLKRKVALKILRPDLASNTTALKRFEVEATAVARATHANIVQVYAIGEDNGIHYMALEYVEGRNLREFLEKKGPPDVLVCLTILRQIASALQRASELGIIHRDIKPENILLTRKGEVKVADFGLSRVFVDDNQPLNLTGTGITMGTPLYMSPEQVEGKTVDPRTDIYSMGVTAYHMLTGGPPFRGNTPFEVAVQHVQKDPPPLSEVRPDLPRELCAIVHKMLAKNPADRYQTCKEIVRDLAQLRDYLVGVSGAQGGPNAPGFSTSTLHSSSGSSPSMSVPARRNWSVVLTLGVVAVGLVSLGIGWWTFSNRSEATPPELKVTDVPAKRPKTVAEKEQELEESLKKDFAKFANPRPEEVDLGLYTAMKLVLFYLERERYEDAEVLFQKLKQTEPEVRYYQYFGLLGEATVLAFRDEYQKSNTMFERMLTSQKGLPKQPILIKLKFMTNPQMRKMLAMALQRNYANAPDEFPAQLHRFRIPPQPPRANGKRPFLKGNS